MFVILVFFAVNCLCLSLQPGVLYVDEVDSSQHINLTYTPTSNSLLLFTFLGSAQISERSIAEFDLIVSALDFGVRLFTEGTQRGVVGIPCPLELNSGPREVSIRSTSSTLNMFSISYTEEPAFLQEDIEVFSQGCCVGENSLFASAIKTYVFEIISQNSVTFGIRRPVAAPNIVDEIDGGVLLRYDACVDGRDSTGYDYIFPVASLGDTLIVIDQNSQPPLRSGNLTIALPLPFGADLEIDRYSLSVCSGSGCVPVLTGSTEQFQSSSGSNDILFNPIIWIGVLVLMWV